MSYERNPIIYAPREGVDYLTCRSCVHCLLAFAADLPERLPHGDVGICIIETLAINPDTHHSPLELPCHSDLEE